MNTKTRFMGCRFMGGGLHEHENQVHGGLVLISQHSSA